MPVLDEILALTETVEQHVERGEWAEAGALDAERCRLLAELIADPGSSADVAACREVLQNLLFRNQQTIQRVQQQQQQLARASATHDRATGAVRAYRRNTDPGNLVYLRRRQGNTP